ncbi:hypothetical protein [Rhodococcus ruber]
MGGGSVGVGCGAGVEDVP